jgi:hypothetical protein
MAGAVMKRSEALEQIQALCSSYGAVTPNQLAKKILDKLEHLGMLPPTITVMKNTYNRADGTYGFDANEWELEDDTN